MSFFRDMSLKFKITLFVLFALAVVFTVCACLMAGCLKTYNKTIYTLKTGEIKVNIRQTEKELDSIEALSEEYMTQAELQNGVEEWFAADDAYTKKLAREKTEEELTRLATRRQYISAAVLSDLDGRIISQYTNRAGMQEHYNEILKVNIPKDGSNYWIEPKGDSKLFTSARTVRKVKDKNFPPMGTLYIVVDMDRLLKSACPDIMEENVSMFIYGEDKIYESGSFDGIDEVEKFLKTEESYELKNYNGRKYFMINKKSELSGYKYAVVMDFNAVFSNIVRFNALIITFFVFVFVFLLVLCSLVCRKTLNRLELLCDDMQKVENGDFVVEKPSISEESKDEIDILSRRFYLMANEIDTLINEKYKKEILLKETQLKILHSQIKPHFLYNTLDTINWMAISNGQKEISALVKALGNLLRSTISKNQFVVTVEEELSLLADYILIQKKRFGDGLDFSFDVEKELYNYSVLKLSIQILVENSIKHVLEKEGGICKIKVGVKADGDNLKISVSDNGKGIAEEKLLEIKNGSLTSNGGIGLENIKKRIKLIYGEAYGLDIFAGAEGGTTVTMTIPKKEVHSVDRLAINGGDKN